MVRSKEKMAKRIREKALERKQNQDNRPYACAKYISLSPSKVGIVLDTVRGKKCEEAVAILSVLPNNAASVVLKLINSAVANAEHNKGMNRQKFVCSRNICRTWSNNEKTNASWKGFCK